MIFEKCNMTKIKFDSEKNVPKEKLILSESETKQKNNVNSVLIINNSHNSTEIQITRLNNK